MTAEQYNARVERELRERFPLARDVVVTSAAPTHRGFKIVSRSPKPDAAGVIYYRKAGPARGGWGRSVQLLEVA